MTAYTLMTALPPTKGHLHLMQFVHSLSAYDNKGRVIVTTQEKEPFHDERYLAIFEAGRALILNVLWLHRELPQDPNSPGFWDLWKSIMTQMGFQPGDTFVSSESYGATMAKVMGGVFIPYDPQRELFNIKATPIRMEENGLLKHFDEVMPSFQKYLRPKITIFGAESTGKTSLSQEFAGLVNGHWLYEWARPYLELVGPEITKDSMNAIWHGQAAAQRHTDFWYDKPYLIQDTDLYSTIGYWEQPHWEADLGPVPNGLIEDAEKLKSDLYLINQSNLPFEEDPIRYGVNKRESSDEYWISVAEKYNLPYVVIKSDNFRIRVGEAMWQAKLAMNAKQELIN